MQINMFFFLWNTGNLVKLDNKENQKVNNWPVNPPTK